MSNDHSPSAPGGLAGLMAAAGAESDARARSVPPVHLWNPAYCGDIDIRIARDGTWFHEGSPIGRVALVRLFSTVLRRDPDGFYLVTPVEKLRIAVEDVPFLAVRVDRLGPVLRFETNVGDVVEAGPEHVLDIRVDGGTEEPAPYLHVRRGLMARLSRPVFYELVDLAETRATPTGEEVGVWSHGMWFKLGSAPAEA